MSALREYLAALCLPSPLLSTVLDRYESCQSRLWLLDDSSSMRERDGHVSAPGSGGCVVERSDSVSRWEELRDCVSFHSRMASRCHIPTKFYLVGSGEKFPICWSASADVSAEMDQLKRGLNDVALESPVCPLASRIRGVRASLAKEAESLAARGKQVTVVICTQGVPTDSKGNVGPAVRTALRSELQALTEIKNVKVIIRLCTDDAWVRDTFNMMDSVFDSMDVLDNYWGEAMEVYLHNPWLTYSLGLHRLREAGLAPELLDDLDERPLSLDEIHQLAHTFFVGEDGLVNLPLPTFSGRRQSRFKDENFYRTLSILIEKEKPQWNPVKKKLTPWIDIEKLKEIHRLEADTSRYWERESIPNEKDASDSSQRSDYPSYQHRKKEPQASSAPEPRRRREFRRSQSERHAPRQSPPAGSNTFDHSQTSRVQSPNITASMTLEEVLRRWSHQPPDYKTMSRSLPQLLVTIPSTFPPGNPKVEDHEYFDKWKEFDKDAFTGASGDEFKCLLKRAARKTKFFLHDDKLPKDATENQKALFKTIWHVIAEREAALG